MALKNLLAIQINKAKITINKKTVHLDKSVLDISKIAICDYCHA